MNKLRNNKMLSAVLRTVISEIADDKELSTQFSLARTVMNDMNETVESHLYLAAAIDSPNSDLQSTYNDASESEMLDCLPTSSTGNTANNYTGSTIYSRFTDLDFKIHFGVSRTTIEIIIGKMALYFYSNRPQTGRPALPMETKLIICLWMLTTQDTYTIVSGRFNISKGVCHRIFFDTCELLYNMIGQAVIWPKQSEWTHLQSTFKSATGMPGVVGVIGSCHIPIKTNTNTKELYTNERSYTSVVLQGICTPDSKFIDIYVGWPGSISCDQIFRSSDVYCGISTNASQFLPQDGHLTGSLAFPLESFLLTPYLTTTDLNDYEKTYNVAVSRCWYILRKSFSLLHERFKRLQCFDVARIDALPKMISAACVLHNMFLELEKNAAHAEVNDDSVHYLDIAVIGGQDNPLNSMAELKRDTIARKLNRNDFYC